MDGEVIDLVSSDEEAAAGSPATGRTGRRSLGRRQSGAGTQSTTAPLNESLDTPPTAKRRRDAWSLPSSSTGWSPAESHAGRAAASPARSFVGAGAGAGCGSADASLSDEVTVELGASLGGGDSDDEEPMPLRARLARRVDSSRLAAVQDGSGSDLVTPRRRDTTPVHQGGSGARFEPEMGSPAIDLTQDGGGSVGPDDSDDATMHLSFGISPVGTPPITTPRTARRSERRGSVARRPYSGVGTPTNKRPRTSAADDSSSDGDGADDFGAQPLIERINTQKRAAALSQGISSQVAAMRVSPKEGSAARRRGALIATAAASGGMRAQRAGGRGTSSGLKRSLSAAPSTPARHRTGATPASEASGARLHSGSRTRRSSERRLRAGAGAGAGRSPGVGTPEGALSFPPAVCVVADVARAAPGCDVDALLSPSGPDSGGDGAGRVEELTTPRTRKQREVLQRREEAARKRAEKAQTKRSAKHSKFVVRQQQGRFGSREVCLVLSKEMAKGDLGSALHAGLADVYKDAFPGDAPITRQIETESRPRGVKFAAWERRTMHFAGGAEVLSNKARWVNLAFIVLRGSQLVDAFVRGGRDLCARLTRACVEALPSATIRPVVLVIDAKGAVSEKQLEFQRTSVVSPTGPAPITLEALDDIATFLHLVHGCEMQFMNSKEEVATEIAKVTAALARVNPTNRPTDLAFAPRRDRGVISSELQNAGMRLDDVNDATIAWAAMLAVLPGVSGKKAAHIVKHYPSPAALMAQYRSNILTHDQKATLLADCMGGGRRQVRLSQRVFEVLTSEDPDAVVAGM